MSAWLYMSDAPKLGEILLDLGETIPGSKDIRVGSWISQSTAHDLGEDLGDRGGWLIWNTDCDWFVIGFNEARSWAEIPR